MDSIQVVAFDLDDTLLRLAPNFIPQYLHLLDESIREKVPSRASLAKVIMASAERMMQKPRDAVGLSDFFYQDFEQRTGLRRDMMEPHLERFFQERFPRLEHLSRPVYGAMGLLATLKEIGYRMALLTSPLFPRVAIDIRLRWAGLEGFPFDWRTSFEVVHATKPQPGYYLEAAEALGIDPCHWLMVGNDFREDIIPAQEAGMAVYWVNDHLREADRLMLPPDVKAGSLYRMMEALLDPRSESRSGGGQ